MDTSDPGKAAAVVWAAAELFCRVSGMNAENQQRAGRGEAMAYHNMDYESVLMDVTQSLNK